MIELIYVFIGFLAGFPLAYAMYVYLLKKDSAMLDDKIKRLQIEQNILASQKIYCSFEKGQQRLKKIYVVTSGTYDACFINKMFVSKKSADKYCYNKNKKYNCDDYRVEEFNISNR